MFYVILLTLPMSTRALDVAVFGVLKLYWAEEREKYECTKGQKVMKENFLAIYGAAHIRALTPETICSAFRETRAWPFNPSVITAGMMAPSIKTSCHGNLPLVQTSPV